LEALGKTYSWKPRVQYAITILQLEALGTIEHTDVIGGSQGQNRTFLIAGSPGENRTFLFYSWKPWVESTIPIL